MKALVSILFMGVLLLFALVAFGYGLGRGIVAEGGDVHLTGQETSYTNIASGDGAVAVSIVGDGNHVSAAPATAPPTGDDSPVKIIGVLAPVALIAVIGAAAWVWSRGGGADGGW